MPTITSRVHPETASSVVRLVANWTAGSWNSSSLALAIPPGLAEHRATTLSLFSAFVTCYCSRCLSARGKCHDLQHLSPMLTHNGNSVCRDMAHMIVGPIDTAKLHSLAPFPKQPAFLNCWVLRLCRSKRDSLMTSPVQKRCQGRTSFRNRSSRVEVRAFPWQGRQSLESVYS